MIIHHLMNSWWFGVADNLQIPQNAPKKHVCSSWNIHHASKWTLGPPTDELCQRRALQNAGLASCKKSRKRLGRFVALHLEFHETSTIHMVKCMVVNDNGIFTSAFQSVCQKKKQKNGELTPCNWTIWHPNWKGPGIHKCSFGRWNVLSKWSLFTRHFYFYQGEIPP